MKQIPVNGCRYCGELERGHAILWADGVGWHTYVEPSDEVRKSRLLVRQRQARATVIPSL